MEALITMFVVAVIFCIIRFWPGAWPKKQPPKRQQWASRSPEKLSQAEQQFCLLVARGIKPSDAADGLPGNVLNPRAMAAKWMKKPKIVREIEDVKGRSWSAAIDAGLEDAIRTGSPVNVNFGGDGKLDRVCYPDGSFSMPVSPDDTPTADLTEEVGTRIKAAEPWEGL